MRLADRVSEIKPSATFAVSAKARALRAQGIDVVSFATGEPDFPTPEHIGAAAIQAIRDGFTRYTAVGGIDELKEAIIAEFAEYYGLSYQAGEIVVSCGAKHSIYNAIQALINPGDEVLIVKPYWVSYPDIVRLAGGVPVEVATTEEDGYKLRPEALAAAVSERTRLLILNSPCNPTGATYSRAELEALAPVILREKLTVISDDIYYRLRFKDEPWCNLAMLGPELKARTLVVNGVSKAYAMTGWRIGYLAGPSEVAAAVTKLQGQNTSNPTSIAQKAAVAALTGPQDCVEQMVQEYARRRRHILARLEGLPGVTVSPPAGAFYVFANFSSYMGKTFAGKEIANSLDLATILLEQAHVAVVPGGAFGEDHCLRFSFATSMEQIDAGLDRLEAILGRIDAGRA